MCMTFGALTVLAALVLVLDLATRHPEEEAAHRAPVPARFEGQKMGPPPWWTLPLMVLAAVLLLAALTWLYSER